MKHKDIKYICSIVVRLVVFLIAVFVGKKLLSSDFTPFFNWWLMLFVITMIFYPVIGVIFKKFHDGGWIFSKTIGIALSGYLLWLLSSMKMAKFTDDNCRAVIAVCFLLNLVLAITAYLVSKKGKETGNEKYTIQTHYNWNRDKLKSMLTVEVMFFILFLLWVYIRAFRPEVSNTESPMDYGFMAAMMRTDYLPAQDIWMAGKSINYYYVGQYFATFMTKAAGVTVSNGYPLALMTIAGCAFTLAYSLIYNVTHTFIADCVRKRRETGRKLIPYKIIKFPGLICTLAGSVAAVAVTFAANMHYVIYYGILCNIKELLGLEKGDYWWPNSTRYIGYRPEISDDKTIHEFPSYSFILGDLHAHVANIIFVMSVLGLLFAYLLYRKEKMDQLRNGMTAQEPSFLKEALHPIIILLGFFIGLFHMTNFWDFPIYYVVCGAIILFSNGVLYQFSWKTIYMTAIHAVVIMLMAKIVALPFTLQFEQISTSICFTYHHTLPYQMLILWGLPVITIVCFTIARYQRLRVEGYITNKEPGELRLLRLERERNTKDNKKGSISFIPVKNKLFQFIESLPISDLFIITIGLCGIGLIILPEIIYVEDIYGSYARANTMFKLTYQGYIMFALSMGYILIRTICYSHKLIGKIFAVVGFLLLAWTSWYTVTAVGMWQGNIFKTEKYVGLDSIAFMENRCMDDYQAINWLNENVTGSKVIVESYGASYSNYNRISAFTGLSTIIGWQTHEHLWRSGAADGFPPEVTERNEDVTSIYTSTDLNEILYYLKKYDVDYVYIGSMEKEQFGEIYVDVLKQVGEVVFDSLPTDTKDYETVIIQVDKSLYRKVTDVNEILNDGQAR